jgi:serine/threonine protein kinase
MKEFENYIVLAIENARGGTLADLIKKRNNDGKPLEESECAIIIKGILNGLKHISKFEYIHRDLKPSNVVIDDINNLETVKLVDFGLAIKF